MSVFQHKAAKGKSPANTILKNHRMKNIESIAQKLVKKPTIARRYDVNERTIQEWMRNGTIPFLKIGYMVRFNPEACDRALARFHTNVDALASRSI